MRQLWNGRGLPCSGRGLLRNGCGLLAPGVLPASPPSGYLPNHPHHLLGTPAPESFQNPQEHSRVNPPGHAQGLRPEQGCLTLRTPHSRPLPRRPPRRRPGSGSPSPLWNHCTNFISAFNSPLSTETTSFPTRNLSAAPCKLEVGPPKLGF